jgi:hypothetical protein
LFFWNDFHWPRFFIWWVNVWRNVLNLRLSLVFIIEFLFYYLFKIRLRVGLIMWDIVDFKFSISNGDVLSWWKINIVSNWWIEMISWTACNFLIIFTICIIICLNKNFLVFLSINTC